jgi:hypothetical protein
MNVPAKKTAIDQILILSKKYKASSGSESRRQYSEQLIYVKSVLDRRRSNTALRRFECKWTASVAGGSSKAGGYGGLAGKFFQCDIQPCNAPRRSGRRSMPACAETVSPSTFCGKNTRQNRATASRTAPFASTTGIGAVIGHEISHGFDDQGARYDGVGNLRDWWTAADHKNFAAKTKKLVAQYNGYSPVKGYNANGELTLGENIADNSGVAIARPGVAHEDARAAADRPGQDRPALAGPVPRQRHHDEPAGIL